MSSPDPSAPPPVDEFSGSLYVFVAFDWGDEVNLEQAGLLAPGASLALSRRPRTPTSIGYKPPPLQFQLAPLTLDLAGAGPMPAQSVEATLFDFAAVSFAFRIAVRRAPAELAALAGRLSDPATGRAVVRAAREALAPLHQKLLPAIVRPKWKEDFWEEYFVFQFPPGSAPAPAELLGARAKWLAGLLRLEDRRLSDEEAAEAVRLSLRYGVGDLFVPDWAAAVLLDDEQECLETLQTIEFANLQLLEYRHIDDRLDANLTRASQLIQRTARARFPFVAGRGAPLRVFGELKVEAAGLFERTGNVLKLVGDQYLARVYRLLAERFHLREWERSIRRKLEVIEGVYKVVSDQASTFRMEFFEVIVIVLIFVEVLLAIFRR
jgi:hypothetical protein